ncbi:MAG: cyclopropane fatty-acyl-phospholipid synthase-like methyltransferase [Arenicella sp.]|jgi:cyclopropane fatty-acyl-phospholipid synthase-like methyltransferase
MAKNTSQYIMNSDVSRLSDKELVNRIESIERVPKHVIDEYYRRCIPLYLDFLGTHWHTGFYLDDQYDVSAKDQIRMIDHLASLVDLAPGHKVLDVGCGIGASLIHLRQRFSVTATGLTPVPEQKKMAEYLAQQYKVSIKVDLGHAESLPYPDHSFDTLMFFESACHFEDRAAFFREAHRVLKPGGKLIGEDWVCLPCPEQSAESSLVNNICKTWAIPMLGTPTEYQSLMANAGLNKIEVTDMRELMPLHRGFAVTESDQAELRSDIAQCSEPLLQLTLKGIASLGIAFKAGVFSIAQFAAQKPTEEV